jgi:tRNA threonylcarbamoyladenosine biosynthesis protein TsaE
VHSPTFALLREHRGKIPLCHADLYRLASGHTRGLGLEEYLRHGSGWVTAVEWAERMADWIPETALHVRFECLSEDKRKIVLEGDERWANILEPWMQLCKKY